MWICGCLPTDGLGGDRDRCVNACTSTVCSFFERYFPHKDVFAGWDWRAGQNDPVGALATVWPGIASPIDVLSSHSRRFEGVINAQSMMTTPSLALIVDAYHCATGLKSLGGLVPFEHIVIRWT